MDDSYGKILARQKKWGQRDKDTGELLPTSFHDIEVAPCKREHFIINPEDDSPDARFYPAGHGYKKDMLRMIPKLLCP